MLKVTMAGAVITLEEEWLGRDEALQGLLRAVLYAPLWLSCATRSSSPSLHGMCCCVHFAFHGVSDSAAFFVAQRVVHAGLFGDAYSWMQLSMLAHHLQVDLQVKASEQELEMLATSTQPTQLESLHATIF